MARGLDLEDIRSLKECHGSIQETDLDNLLVTVKKLVAMAALVPPFIKAVETFVKQVELMTQAYMESDDKFKATKRDLDKMTSSCLEDIMSLKECVPSYQGNDLDHLLVIVKKLVAMAALVPPFIKKVETIMKQVELVKQAYIESEDKLKATKCGLDKMASTSCLEEKNKTAVVEAKPKEALLSVDRAEQSLKLAEGKGVVLEKKKESLQKRAGRGELIGTSKRAKGPSADGRFGS